MPPWGKALSAQRFDHAHRPEHVEGQIWFLVNYMRFLQENGRELARKHPELAQTAVILPGMVPQVAPEVVPAPMAERAVAKPAPERPMMVPAAPPKPVTPTAVAQAPPQKIPEKAPTKEAPASVVEAKPSGPVPVEPPTSAAPKPATAHPGHEKAAQALAAWKSLIAFDPSRNIPGLRGNAASGRIYYVENCATCHGAEGKGDGPTATAAHMDPMPRNHTDGVYMNPKSDADLHKVIAEGGIAVGKSIWMPDWADKLSDEQIWDLIAYMRTIAVPRYTLKVKK
jgi:mono/diheme cytochrome c family protein